MGQPRVLVVTSCTGEKRSKPDNQLMLEDFKDSARLQKRHEELAEFVCPAGQMYTGVQHLRVMEGVRWELVLILLPEYLSDCGTSVFELTVVLPQRLLEDK